MSKGRTVGQEDRMMSGRAQVAALDCAASDGAEWSQAAARWLRRIAEAQRARQKRARVRAAVVPMRGHLLRDIGLVEADARRRGLPL
jgi:uncharacterized protein YjiS (DUF1127 family)